MKSEEFIYEYLKCDRDTGSGSYEKLLDAIKEVDDWDNVKQYIVRLKYFYYLKTSMWRIISEEVKRRANWRCACGCRENLQVHHTEEGNNRHGEEHLFLDTDLICLCKKCHREKHPSFSIKSAEKKRQNNNRKDNILAQVPYYPKRIDEEKISGSSFTLTRKLLEELEHERKIFIDRPLYEGWKINRV